MTRILNQHYFKMEESGPVLTYDELILSKNPFVYLKLDETEGDTAVDSSGNGNDFTIAFVPEGGYAVPVNDALGVGLRGVTDETFLREIANSITDNNETALTVEFWMDTSESWPGDSEKLAFGDWNGVDGIDVSIFNDGDNYFTGQRSTPDIRTFAAYTNHFFESIGLQHIVVVMEVGAANPIFYFNGVASTMEPAQIFDDEGPIVDAEGIQWGPSPTPFSFGGWDNALTKVAIYLDVLTPQEVAAHYAKGLS